MTVRLLKGVAMAAALFLFPAAAAARQSAPADWKWRQDAPAPLAPGAEMKPGSWVFVQMPPGWHVTTGPGVLLFPAAHGDAAGNFSIEAEIFLFPGESLEEYGIFLGGASIEAGDPSYTAFVLRRDGRAEISKRPATVPAAGAASTVANAMPPQIGAKEAVKNTIRVDVSDTAVTMTVNGVQVLSRPRQDYTVDGRFGFRIGKDMNLHIATLNVTRRLAPAPIKKESK